MLPPLTRIAFALALLIPLVVSRGADDTLVSDGQPQAEIIIAERPPRTVRLAAQELQNYVEKISGAKLTIATEPSGRVPVQVYVGRSAQTDRLKITGEGLKDGAYRIVSGEHWLVLIGDDGDFTPIEPWAKRNSEIVSGKTQGEWDKITGALWGLPNVLMYKNLISLPGETGRPTAAATGPAEPLPLWGFDERGSFNAVNGFLQSLGVRWYLPGDLGEVRPSLRTIALPKIDETVRPDFALRRFNFRFGVLDRETALRAMRLGLRDPSGIQDAHGLDTMTHRDEIFAAHPEWFALYGGQRQTQRGQRLNQLCYSNEELFQETVGYVRAQFDHYQFDAVSIMPPDGYTAICQCPRCAGKDSPERGNRGLLSDYVWGFVNRVAREVRKTHPDRKVLNCAYGTYSLPPLKIARLEPNVLVSLVGGRRPMSNRPEEQEECRQLRESWRPLTGNPIINFENYPFTDRGWYLPSFTPHSIGASINALKGRAQGEDIWLSVRQDFSTVGIGFNHFPVYFTARMYWGGQEQDVDALFREYCRLFYGPAEQEMHRFFTYCEAHWPEMEKDKTKADAALALFATAQAQAEPGSVFGQRLALLDDYLRGLRNKSRQLGQPRGPVPQLRLVGEARGKIVIDGRLDDDAWVNCPAAATGHLRELQTGRAPIFGTTVKSAWIGNNLYFAIRCEEHPGEKLHLGTTKKGDSALWFGDAIEVLVETESHSYYQIAVNPAGAAADLDRSAARPAWSSWDSQAEVATEIADDHWTVELRIPVSQDENDPLHQVIGHHPTMSLPWHFNVCRQRLRDHAQEFSAFSPTGTDHFHEVMKFATYYDGRAQQFEAAAPEADYLEATRLAADFTRRGRPAEALAAYTAAAEGKRTDFQKSAALEQAAAVARSLHQHDRADQLAARIPIDAVQKTVLMQNLLDQSKAPQVIEQFSPEDLSAWPFWKVGDGCFARGRAYAIVRAGPQAEADLSRALEWTSDPRLRDSIRQTLGSNRENNLHDDDGALVAYREIIATAGPLGSADQFLAIQGIARILTRHREFEGALGALRKIEFEKIGGVWRGSLLLTLGDTLQAAGRNEEARATFNSVIVDQAIDSRFRQRAAETLAKSLK